jgi:hypothetical protein
VQFRVADYLSNVIEATANKRLQSKSEYIRAENVLHGFLIERGLQPLQFSTPICTESAMPR